MANYYFKKLAYSVNFNIPSRETDSVKLMSVLIRILYYQTRREMQIEI